MIKGSFPQNRFVLHESYVIASSRILEEDLIKAVFDGLSDEDESDNEGEGNIYGFLGDPVLRRADLMAANLGEDKGEDQDEQFHCDLMAWRSWR